MGQRFVVLVLFVGLVGICFCGCENQGQKVERLIKELQHRKAKVRANAAMALFNPPNAAEGAVPDLIQALQDRDKGVRADVARALVQIGTPDAIKAVKDTVSVLIQALQDRDKGVRADATYVLGAIGESAKDAVPALTLAFQDLDPEVRQYAAEALMQIGTPEALKAVEEYQSQQ